METGPSRANLWNAGGTDGDKLLGYMDEPNKRRRPVHGGRHIAFGQELQLCMCTSRMSRLSTALRIRGLRENDVRLTIGLTALFVPSEQYAHAHRSTGKSTRLWSGMPETSGP